MEAFLLAVAALSPLASATVAIPTTSSAKPGLLSSFISFSFELDSVPNYAGKSMRDN